ncbi:hypothetical protein RhiTH_007491 [Rhizoctonia solani]
MELTRWFRLEKHLCTHEYQVGESLQRFPPHTSPKETPGLATHLMAYSNSDKTNLDVITPRQFNGVGLKHSRDSVICAVRGIGAPDIAPSGIWGSEKSNTVLVKSDLETIVENAL